MTSEQNDLWSRATYEAGQPSYKVSVCWSYLWVSFHVCWSHLVSFVGLFPFGMWMGQALWQRHLGPPWAWLQGSTRLSIPKIDAKLYVSFAKEAHRTTYLLQKRPIISSSLLTVATPWKTSDFKNRCKICFEQQLYLVFTCTSLTAAEIHVFSSSCQPWAFRFFRPRQSAVARLEVEEYLAPSWICATVRLPSQRG